MTTDTGETRLETLILAELTGASAAPAARPGIGQDPQRAAPSDSQA